MIELLEPTFAYGDFPETPVASDLALKADTTEAEASAMIKLAWSQVESFTKRTYRDITTGVVIVKVKIEMPFQWPRFPFPVSLGVEVLSQGSWVPHSESYVASVGWVELVPFTLYRLTQVGTVSVVRSRTFYRSWREFFRFDQGDRLVVSPDFVSVIGTLLPIALCGRSSL